MENHMGTWAHGPFDNDTACDWAYDLVRTRDYALVAKAIERVLEAGDGYLEADAAVEAVAAAEVLAKSLGRGTQTDAYTESVDAWLASLPARPDPTLLVDARAALGRILGDDSELKDLWGEGQHLPAWTASMQVLQSALGG
jgi:hypothetical protein